MKISIAELKQKYRIESIIARDTVLKAKAAGVLRGHHCDKHDNEQELTVWTNHGYDGYFYCNRCGLNGDVIAWIGYKMFGSHYDAASKAQLEQIARSLGESSSSSSSPSAMVTRQTKKKNDAARLLTPAAVAQANYRLLHNAHYHAHREYLAGRGIHVDQAKKWLIGAYKQEVIIPVASGGDIAAVVKRRIDKKQYHLLGSADALFNGDILPCPEVLLCEGVFDAILEMAVYGVPAVAMVGGVRSFPERYFSKLRKCGTVWIALDNDAAGNSTAHELGAVLPNSARFELDNYHDVTDFILALN